MSRIRRFDFSSAARDGRLTTVVWLLLLVLYVGFHLAHINTPELTNAFVAVTGVWVGNLGIAQGRKIQQVEEQVAERGVQTDRMEREGWDQHRRIEALEPDKLPGDDPP